MDALGLMWTEPLSWLIVGVTLVGAVVAVARRTPSPVRAVAAIVTAVWLVAALAMTVYPLEYLEGPSKDRLYLYSIIPLAGTVEALANADGWVMTAEELEAHRRLLASEQGIPVEEVVLSDPRVYGPGVGTVLKDPIGNVVLFLPLGFLVPILWPERRRWWHAAAAGALVSTTIELSQVLFSVGSLGTIDDVIFNTLGALAGFGVWSAALAAARRLRQLRPAVGL